MLPNSMLPNSLLNNIGKTVGERLRAVRRAYNHTQSQLAAPDFSVSYISAIERGQIHPSLRALEILANRLGLSTMQLLPPSTQQEDHIASYASLSEGDTDEVAWALLEAELLIRQGAALQAIARLETFSTQPLKQPHQLLHHYLLGWAYLEAEKILECEHMLEEARHMAEDTNDS